MDRQNTLFGQFNQQDIIASGNDDGFGAIERIDAEGDNKEDDTNNGAAQNNKLNFASNNRKGVDLRGFQMGADKPDAVSGKVAN